MDSTLVLNMPAEWSHHESTWMAWPYNTMQWRKLPNGSIPAQAAFVNIVLAIARFELVNVGAMKDHIEEVREIFKERENVRVILLNYDDIWLRDTGPTFVREAESRQVLAVQWQFNCWGNMGASVGLTYELDKSVASQIADITEAGDRAIAVDIVLEGGSFNVDGEGTVLVTEECLLNSNRNPSKSKADLTGYLQKYLGVSKVIWLPLGLFGDEDTNGHVDNFCCFYKPGHVLLAWTDDEADPQHAISAEALRLLEAETDARGRPLSVTKLHIPPPMFYSEEECRDAGVGEGGALLREPGTRLAGSYVNFYFANGAIVLPGFGDAHSDAEAVRVLQSLFPDREVVQVQTRDILLGGGNIHCITQQQISM